MRRLISVVAFNFLFIIGSLGQESGAQLDSSPGSFGSLQNSVNLYTGQVGFPMTVAALPGRGGLAPKLAINYSSIGVLDNVKTWNREKPTGILGLGWSLNFPKIVCDYNQTVTRHDDTFYLIEGGQPIKLICKLNPNDATSLRIYTTEIYLQWKITYDPVQEKWEIIKDDGMKFIYGDNTRTNAGTVQNMISWGDWIGSSNVKEGQQLFAHTWNISEVENRQGDKLSYYYENIEEEVGEAQGGALTHTKASALKKIVGPLGNYIELTYANKVYVACDVAGDYRCTDKRREYQDPHDEQEEPDAYQEKYESRYLDLVKAYDGKDPEPLYEVKFDYNKDEDDNEKWLGTGEYTKRLLTGIEQTNYGVVKKPKTKFAYINEEGSKNNGLIKSVSNSMGAVITYKYDELISTSSTSVFTPDGLGRRELIARSPGADWTNPNIFMGGDYAVVIWRQNAMVEILPGISIITSAPRPSFLQVYEWDGEWKQHDIGSIGDVRYSNDADKQEIVVALHKEHFAIVNRQGTNTYDVNLFRKSKYDGSWGHTVRTIYNLADGRLADAQYLREISLFASKDYIALGKLTSDKLFTFTWNGAIWDFNTEEFPGYNYLYASTSNGVLMQNTSAGFWAGPDEFYINFLGEDNHWHYQNQFYPGYGVGTVESEKHTDKTNWHSSAGFMVTLADNNPEYAFLFDPNFSTHKKFDLGYYADESFVSMPSTSTLHISRYSPQEFKGAPIHLKRYNGVTWSTNLFENDFIPNLGIFNLVQKLETTSDVAAMSLGDSKLQLSNYNANSGIWELLPITTPVNWLDRYIKVSSNSALAGNKFYYLEPDGQWLEIGEFDYTQGLHGDSWYYDVNSSENLYAIHKWGIKKTEIFNVRNGELLTSSLSKNITNAPKDYETGKRLLGNGIMAAFDNDDHLKYNADHFTLYKWTDGTYQHTHNPIVVSYVTVDDGNLNIERSYDYNTVTAGLSSDGSTPYFNEVTVVNASTNPKVKPRGYTKQYFYNNKGTSDLPKIPTEQLDTDISLFAGSRYRTEVYNAQNELLSSTITVYSTEKRTVYNNTYPDHPGRESIELIHEAYFVRPTLSKTEEHHPNGVQTISTETEYNYFGYPTQIKTYSSNDINQSESTSTVFNKYIYEVYDSATAHIMFSDVVESKTSRDGEIVSVDATVWDFEAPVPTPTKNYSWRGYGSHNFTAWDSEPGSEWRLKTVINKRDQIGNILESEDQVGELEATVFDADMVSPIITASYAAYDEIAATSFETGQSGKFTFADTDVVSGNAITGGKYLDNGSAQVNLPNPKKYYVYYWYKDASASITIQNGTVTDLGDVHTTKGWTLRKWLVDGSGNLTLSTTGLVDEVRIHPIEAYATTYVYNDRGQKVVETGSNMRSTYFYYDDYNRQSHIADHNGDIVKYYEYGFKNLQD